MSFSDSYAFRHPWRGAAINLLLIGALALLLYGLQAPILTLEKFYFFSNTVSLLSALRQLAAQGEWGLFGLVGAFSVVFPILKTLVLLAIWNLDPAHGERHRRHLGWLASYSKWSMLDVFVVALLVVSVKLGSLAEARVEVGIYAFAASVILTMLLSAWIGAHAVDTAQPFRPKPSRGRNRPMHVTLVHVFIKREAITDFVEACRLNHEGSTAEPGNRRFDILQDATDPTHFVLYEAYASEADARAHKETPHYAAWRERVADMMARPREGQPFVGLFPAGD